ncbi:hypothetical protein V1264_017809 [Littorina saxatilis]|uniref:Uncharacterized protein n=2 Tax=Littorina saxatilis TaxID=31220 RepID=A0AAN9BHU7_9CAEN
MLRTLCSLWLLAVMLLECTSADESDFCKRPANMELCSRDKRYLRSRRTAYPGLGAHFAKRDGEKLPENGGTNGYLRFGRSVNRLLMALRSAEGAHLRKRHQRGVF